MDTVQKRPALGMIGAIILLIISLFLFQDACLSDSDGRMGLSLLLVVFFFALAIHAYVQRRRKSNAVEDMNPSPQLRIAETPELNDNDTPVGVA